MKKQKSLAKERKNRNVKKLEGEWVAFANGKIVAHEGTLKKLMKKVKRWKGNQKTSIMLMPKRIEGNYII